MPESVSTKNDFGHFRSSEQNADGCVRMAIDFNQSINQSINQLFYLFDRKYKKLENAWQSLAYSPLGAVVSPPSEYL